VTLDGEQRRHVFDRIMRLQVTGLCDHNRIVRGVRAVEAVPRETHELVPDRVGFRPRESRFLSTAFRKDLAVLIQGLLRFLTDAPAHQVCLARSVTSHIGEDLNHLFLVHTYTHGLGQDGGKDGMYVLRLLLAVQAGNEIRNELHGTGSIERNRGGDMVEFGRPHLHQHAPHTLAFHLEHTHHIA